MCTIVDVVNIMRNERNKISCEVDLLDKQYKIASNKIKKEIDKKLKIYKTQDLQLLTMIVSALAITGQTHPKAVEDVQFLINVLEQRQRDKSNIILGDTSNSANITV